MKDGSMMHAGLWTSMADAIDSQSAVGIPVASLGWVFLKNCVQLDPEMQPFHPCTFKSTSIKDDSSFIFLEPPRTTYKNLISLSILVRPQAVQSLSVNATAVIKIKNGTTQYLVGARRLPATIGGFLMLTGREPIPIKDIQSIAIKFDMPIELAYLSEKDKPVILWMGN